MAALLVFMVRAKDQAQAQAMELPALRLELAKVVFERAAAALGVLGCCWVVEVRLCLCGLGRALAQW